MLLKFLKRAADITPRWAQVGQPEPTFSPPQNRMALKFLNGLLTSRQGGRRMGRPSPRAHSQPTYKWNVANAHQRAADITPGWAEDGLPKPTSPLSAHLKIEFR